MLPLYCFKCGTAEWRSEAVIGEACRSGCGGALVSKAMWMRIFTQRSKSLREDLVALPADRPFPDYPKVIRETVKQYAGMRRPFPAYEVKSSHVICLSYDREARTAYVEFNRMGFYRYHDTGWSEFEAILKAESIGSYFDKHFIKRPDLHPCEKSMPNGDWVPVRPKV